MSKSMVNQRLIYKIDSGWFRIHDYNVNMSFEVAKEEGYVVGIGDSDCLRKIRHITQNEVKEEDINILKRKKDKSKTKTEIKEYTQEIEILKFEPNYIAIEFEGDGSAKDWNYMKNPKNNVFLNGKKIVRLVGTTGGIKNNTVIFVPEEIHEELDRMLNCDRDTSKKYIPAKFEAYKSLACSGSTPVTPPRGILVIEDGCNTIYQDVLKLSDNGNGGFNLHEVKDSEINVSFTDGCGMISPKLAEQWAIDMGAFHYDEKGNKIADYIPSGFNLRGLFSLKGMVAPIPFVEYGDEIGEYLVEDIWGNMIDIRDVDLILTDNMVKLWNGFSSCEEYLKANERNMYHIAVAKMLPRELEDVRNTNYQYLQSYEFTDEQIDELIKPTVESIKGALGIDYKDDEDYIKMLLFLKGENISLKDFTKEEKSYIKALMIDKTMIQDPFIKQKVSKMIKRKIADAKKGVLQIRGSYQVILGDLYGMLQHMFKQEVTGCLKKGEIHSKYWLERDRHRVACFRSPMTIHNNIVVQEVVDNEIIQKYFRYIKTAIVFNMWDTLMEKLNGADFDADAIISTDNEQMLSAFQELPAVICEQNSAKKCKITESLLAKANKNGFNNNVGIVTNRCTNMFDIISKFDKGTPEHEEMLYRITCMQGYQQEIIDSCKGIVPKQVPKTWYDYKTVINMEDGEEKENLLKLLANKKPYFFIYNYKSLRADLNNHNKKYHTISLINFEIGLDELMAKDNKTQEEIDFINEYYCTAPVSFANSTMNRICWKLEEEFKDVSTAVREDYFNATIFMTNKKIKPSLRRTCEDIYYDYKKEVVDNIINKPYMRNMDIAEAREVLIYKYREKFELASKGDYEVLTNCLVDLLYTQPVSKQLFWDICGDYVVEKLLKDNDYMINIPVLDDNGISEWKGKYYNLTKEDISYEYNI